MLRLKSLFCLDDLFTSEQLYHSHARFNVALSLCMIMTVMLSGWSLPSLLLAFAITKRNSSCASTLPFKPVIPYESTIPIYIWYLLAIPNEDFLVPSQNLIQNFPFCNRTSSWCGEGKSLSSMPKMFHSMTKF